MNMKNNFLQIGGKKIIFVACVFTVLFIGLVKSAVYAQDIYTEIQGNLKKYENLSNEIDVNLDRIHGIMNNELGSSSFDSHALQFDRLNQLSLKVASMQREFYVLFAEMSLAGLVTDKKASVYARRYIEAQRQYIIKSGSIYIKSIEKALPGIREPEINRLFIESRDLFRSSNEFINRMPIK